MIKFQSFRLFFCLIIISLLIPLVSYPEYAIDRNRILRSGCEYDYPPYSYVEGNSTAEGFSIELLREAVSAMGMDIHFKTGYWHEIKKQLKNGELDALPLVGRTPEREAYFDFTIPYLPMHGAIVVRSSNNSIISLEDLSNKTVAVMKGDNAEEFVRKQDIQMNIETTPTFKEALTELSKGEYDAVIIQRITAIQLIDKLNLNNLKIIEPPLKEFRQNFCFAVKEGDKELLALLNEGLAIVMADGTFRKLYTEWFANVDMLGSRRIVIGADYNYPPWEYKDEEGNPAGFNVDITKAIAREMNLNIDFYFASWTEVRQSLVSGRIPIVQGMFYSTQRTKEFSFSSPHSHVTKTVVTRDSEPGITDEELLKDRVIIVQKHDIMHDYALEIGPDSIITVNTPEDALAMLSSGEGECVLIGRIQAYYLIEKNNWTNLKIHPVTLKEFDYCYAVSGNEDILAIFDEGLRIIKQSGEYRKIHSKWFSAYQERDYSGIIKYIIIIIAVLAVLFIIFLIFSIYLRRTVARRTEELRTSENKFRSLIEQASEMLFFHDLDGNIIDVNRAAVKDTGYSKEELEGMNVFDIDLYSEDRNDQIKYWHTLEQDDPPAVLETEHKRRDGSIYPVLVSLSKVHISGNDYILALARNIAKEKEAENALQESEERFRNLFNTMAQGVVYQNRAGVITSANPAAERILGLSLEQMEGKSSIDPDWRAVDEYGKPLPGEKHPVMIALRTGKVVKNFVQGIYNPDKNHYVWIIVNSRPQFKKGEDKPYQVYSTFQDITELKKAQEELMKMDRLYSLGILAGGIAHDFNNILTGIMGNLALIKVESTNNPSVQDFAEDALKALETAKHLTKQLLTFASGGKPVKEIISVRDILEDTAGFVLSGSNVGLDMNIASDILNIEADPGHIKQVIQNIVMNADQAMPEGGNIRISAVNIELKNHVRLDAGKYIRIEICDSGIGIGSDVLKKIFDPYFTTKRKGSGLGLAMSASIIHKHNGGIYVESKPGEGTCFTILLPASDKLAAQKKISRDYPFERKRTGKILVMDDEELIRNISERLLTKAGFTVVTAADGKEAVEEYSNHLEKNEPFDTVILDLTVQGGMGGKQAAEEILDIDSNAKLIVSSGYSDDAVMADFSQYGFSGVVFKPYHIDDILKTVDSVISEE